MTISLMPNSPAAHPRSITTGEQDRLEEEIRGCLLQVSSSDPKIRERKKDLRKGFNKAPNTLAQFLVQAYNEQRPITKRLTDAIGDFFSARTQRLARRLRDLNPIETKREGDMNNLQMAIAQGDLSTPTLKRFVEEIDEYSAVLAEMRAAAVAEIYKAEGPRS
jgi:hypothetical protein